MLVMETKKKEYVHWKGIDIESEFYNFKVNNAYNTVIQFSMDAELCAKFGKLDNAKLYAKMAVNSLNFSVSEGLINQADKQRLLENVAVYL